MSKRHARSRRSSSAPQPRQLAEILGRIALGSSLGLGAGCSQEHPGDLSQAVPRTGGQSAPEPADAGAPGWQAISCRADAPELLVRELAARGADYVAVFHEFMVPSGVDAGTAAVVRVFSESGNPCYGVADDRTCQAALQSLSQPSAACGESGQCGAFVILTEGQEVRRIDTRADVLSWLGGAVASGEQAVLLAQFDGHAAACASAEGGEGTRTQRADGGFDVETSVTTGLCGRTGNIKDVYHVTEDGTLTQTDGTRYLPAPVLTRLDCTGRRPAGLRELAAVSGARSALGAFFAKAARLEAASIIAFERMARELHTLGAPASLLSCALRALEDEVRHTQLTAALARRFGAGFEAPWVAPSTPRTPLEIALENAVEGCVRETYGALLAQHQAQMARDPQIRQVMACLARDEARHAMLAWQLAAWLEPKLTRSEQRELAQARRLALVELASALHSGLPRAEEQLIGWPAPEVADQLLAQLAAALGGDAASA